MNRLSLFLLLALTLAACRDDGDALPATTSATVSRPSPTATVILEGLINPLGLDVLADGTLLVAEEGSGEKDLSAGVTVRLPDGRSGRLLSDFPSGRDAGDLSGVPFVKVSPDGRTLYTAHFRLGHLLTLPLPGTLIIPDTPFTPADLTPAMTPLNAVQLVNPFDLTFRSDGTAVVSDASENGVAVATADGRTRFLYRFAPLDPGSGQREIDPVPTGITRLGDEYFVTLTGGCPYPAGAGRLVAIDDNRNERLIAADLNMPIDVVVGPDDALWLLEFATFDPAGSCFSGAGYQAGTGTVKRQLANGNWQLVVEGLSFPGSMAFGPEGELYISEIFNGRVVRLDGVLDLVEPVALPDLLGEETAVVPPPPLADATSLHFTNVAADVGLAFQHGAFVQGLSADPAAMMGAGLCWLDYDGDGWLDLYLVNSHARAEADYWAANGGLPRNALYRNDAGRFMDVSAGSGADLALRGNGCVAADFDGDGRTDLYVTADGPNALLWNNGDGTFREGADAAGVAAPEWNSAAAVTDVNGDGHLDLFVAAYIDLEKTIERPSGAFPQDYVGLPDRLYLNNNDGTFRDVTIAAGLTLEERGLGALFGDLDDDGDPDLYIANDGHPNRLYALERDESPLGFLFVDVSQASGTNDSGSGMGIAGGDYDRDGNIDLLVTNWDTELNALFRNEAVPGELLFRYSTNRIGFAGLGNNMTGWGTAWADFDRDGDEDLLVVNGHVPIADLAADAQLVRFYGNRLVEGFPQQFREWTEQVGLGADGVGPLAARGSAAADYDNDGDIDVAVNTIGGALVLLQNNVDDGHWLTVTLDPFRPGARVIVTLADGTQLVREARVGSSYLASEDPRLHFGLGAEMAVALRVEWPGGETTTLDPVSANQFIVVKESP